MGLQLDRAPADKANAEQSLETGDQDQDLDRTNTTTRRGTKIQKSKLKRNIVGAQTGYRTAETNFFRAFCGLWVMKKKRI